MADRTSAGLRETLFQEIEDLRSGKVQPPRAKAVAALATALLKSVEVEMHFRDQRHRIGDKDGDLGTLVLAVPTSLPRPAETEARVVQGRDTEDDDVLPARQGSRPILDQRARLTPGKRY